MNSPFGTSMRQTFHGPQGRHRRLDRSSIRHCSPKARRPRTSILPGVSLYVLSVHVASDVRDSSPISRRCRRRGTRRDTTCRSPSTSGGPSDGGRFLFFDVSPSSRIRPSQRSGIGRISGQRARPLRRVPFPAEYPRRRIKASVSPARPKPEGKGGVPNITQFRLKDWSKEDIVYILDTGSIPDFDRVGSAMAQVVRNTSQLRGDARRWRSTSVAFAGGRPVADEEIRNRQGSSPSRPSGRNETRAGSLDAAPPATRTSR